ncbi:MAG: hypothetical protein DWQ02_23070 [Bacteroidetes bacterium]|nr:MAG: hypothetical protein DWQ02_23070 [Bacteroidota bacterium]
MFENLKKTSAQKKVIFLLAGLFLLLIIAYFAGFKKTIEAYRFYQENIAAFEQAEDAPVQIQSIKQRLTLLGNDVDDIDYDREKLFERVNTFCSREGIQLLGFDPEKRKEAEGYEIITTPVRVRGKYLDLVRLVYHLEAEQKVGYIASANFEMKKDRRRKKEFLECQLLIQNINKKQETHEN